MAISVPFRVRAFLCLTLLLAGCASLPSSGPTARNIVHAERDEKELMGLKLINIDATLVRSLRSDPGPASVKLSEITASPGSSDYDVVGPGDVLKISIYEAGMSLFSSRGASIGSDKPIDPGASDEALSGIVVAADGTIKVPYVNRINVKGMTPQAIQRAIEAGLAGKSQSPQVLVNVVQNVSNAVYVYGAVNKPGRYSLTPAHERLLDILTLAGGTPGYTEDLTLRLLRGSGVGEARLADIDGSSTNNISLKPGDRIEVLRRQRSIAVFGASPKVSQIDFGASSLSLAEAVARAGGPSEQQADPTAIFVFRYEPSRQPGVEEPVIYRLNLMKPTGYLLAQRFPMKDKDVLYIANARANQAVKLVQIIGQLFTPVAIAREVAR